MRWRKSWRERKSVSEPTGPTGTEEESAAVAHARIIEMGVNHELLPALSGHAHSSRALGRRAPVRVVKNVGSRLLPPFMEASHRHQNSSLLSQNRDKWGRGATILATTCSTSPPPAAGPVTPFVPTSLQGSPLLHRRSPCLPIHLASRFAKQQADSHRVKISQGERVSLPDGKGTA